MLSDPGVFLRVQMPILAGVACPHVKKGVYQVFSMGNNVQVQWIAARAHVALVMNFFPFGDFTNKVLIENTMRTGKSLVDSNHPIADATLAPLPDPASGIGLDLNMVQNARNRRGWLAKAGGCYYIGHADIAPKLI